MPYKYGKSTRQGEKKISLNQQDLAIFSWLFLTKQLFHSRLLDTR